MSFRPRQNLKLILHPYVFVLKEGIEIKKDYLDYSLMMLMVASPETIKSPVGHPKEIPTEVSEVEFLKATLPSAILKIQEMST